MTTSPNHDTRAATAFHAATKYVAMRDETGAERFMMGTPPDIEEAIWEEDWSLEPHPFKEYETPEPLPIPREFPVSTVPALEALARTGAESAAVGTAPDRSLLARIGLLSNGLLDRRVTRRGTTVNFRTAGGTGARYHLELYFVCGDLPDLEAGVYHYAAHDHSLRQVRVGDFRGALVEATGDEPAVSRAPVVLVMTSTFWRNAWRYKARAYRHTYWDAGTSLSHVLAVASSAGVATRLVLGYADEPVNALLGVDGVREAAVALCAVGAEGESPVAPTGLAVPVIDHPTRPISPREVTFPAIPTMHLASSLTSGAEAAEWRSNAWQRTDPEPAGELITLEPLAGGEFPAAPVEDVIFRRRSTRNYDTGVDIAFSAFSTLLDRSSRGFAADCLAPDARPLHDCYLIVNGVEGLAPGVYVHHPRRGAVELLARGEFREQARRIALMQWYTADAHVNAYYLTDLAPVLQHYGNRGYRLAQLECSLFAGKLHLGSHALGLGAVGSTSFDDEVVDFFSPHAAGKSFMFVTVFGKRRPRGRP